MNAASAAYKYGGERRLAGVALPVFSNITRNLDKVIIRAANVNRFDQSQRDASISLTVSTK